MDHPVEDTTAEARFDLLVWQSGSVAGAQRRFEDTLVVRDATSRKPKNRED